jgi:hypothetical protein
MNGSENDFMDDLYDHGFQSLIIDYFSFEIIYFFDFLSFNYP